MEGWSDLKVIDEGRVLSDTRGVNTFKTTGIPASDNIRGANSEPLNAPRLYL